jgi:hypothetical protein
MKRRWSRSVSYFDYWWYRDKLECTSVFVNLCVGFKFLVEASCRLKIAEAGTQEKKVAFESSQC